MSEPIFLYGGQHCRNVIKKASFQGWSTSPEQVVTMDQNRWSRWIGIYTNGIENFWSHLKRGIDGIYHQISKEHLQAYIDEFLLRFNTRKFTTQNRFDLVLSGVTGKRLKYQNLKKCQ
jgi:hypothetical protein